jgi:hypothetical protein
MRITLLLTGLGILGAFVWYGCCHEQPRGETPETKPATMSTTMTAGPSTANAVNGCMRCHPWEDVMAASATYETPEGEKANPHMYVPHDSKLAADIPDCLKCHTTHPLSPEPKKGEIDLKAVSVKWCYDACHHEKNFERCDKCH